MSLDESWLQDLRENLTSFASKMARIQDHVLEQSGSGLSYRTYRILVRVDQGRDTLTRLGEEATITYSALSQAVASNTAGGYLERRKGDKDKREAHLRVTDAGESAKAQAQQALDDFVQTLLVGMSPSAVKRFADAMRLLLSNLDTVGVGLGLRPETRAARTSGSTAPDPKPASGRRGTRGPKAHHEVGGSNARSSVVDD